ncbi:hypothetical protein K3759_16985 (plasmid) [Sulfitobacter sp. W027]|uniref:hypothetical protein n=1 Tax=Sulfitobacter sp. W027 TaxID=2867025 RepID=UPI0021A92A12|nr:hypothetical protein [Sulfitobacter sp. W027]UWR35341.1 hypothetical protein K3759_16985 [Sulfitobacter sp. W027]|tara:strand:- start:308 stop:517 length:210 start_codon:yes stop_codon:yes gene_type:complete
MPDWTHLQRHASVVASELKDSAAMIRAVVKFLAGLVVTLVVVIFIGRFASPLPEVENRHDRGALLRKPQ